jgi:hypothetical protein
VGLGRCFPQPQAPSVYCGGIFGGRSPEQLDVREVSGFSLAVMQAEYLFSDWMPLFQGTSLLKIQAQVSPPLLISE